MKGYCTTRDVRLALTPQADETDQATAASLPDYQIEDAIDEAEGIVDSFTSMRYTIPTDEIEVINPDDPLETWVFVVAPVPVRGITRDVAAYLSALTFRKNKDLPEDDPIRLRFILAMGMLQDILDGKRNLPEGTFPEVDSDSQGVHVENLYQGKLFNPQDFGVGYGDQVYDSQDPLYSPQVYWPARSDV